MAGKTSQSLEIDSIDTSKINDRQKLFAEYYVQSLNATQAAIKAGYSENGATVAASETLANVNVKAYISKLQRQTSAKIKVSHDELTRRLKAWIDADLTQFLTLTPDEIQQLPIDLRRLITSMKPTKYGYELKFVSKEKAIEMVAKHIGYFDLDNSQKAARINVQELSTDVLIAIAQAKKEN